MRAKKRMDYDEDICPDLAVELAETRKSRDEWCAEYVRVRDELAEARKDLEFYKGLSLKPATYAIGSGAL